MTIAREANLLAHPENEELSVARDTYASIRHHCVSFLKEVRQSTTLLAKAPSGIVSQEKLSTFDRRALEEWIMACVFRIPSQQVMPTLCLTSRRIHTRVEMMFADRSQVQKGFGILGNDKKHFRRDPSGYAIGRCSISSCRRLPCYMICGELCRMHT